jgi:hypothetical protein
MVEIRIRWTGTLAMIVVNRGIDKKGLKVTRLVQVDGVLLFARGVSQFASQEVLSLLTLEAAEDRSEDIGAEEKLLIDEVEG